MLGLPCCAGLYLVAVSRGYSLAAVSGLLIAVASLLVEHRLSVFGLNNCGMWASVVAAQGLQSTGSIVVAHELSCCMVCGVFLDQGLNPCFLHWQVDSLPLNHQGSPH